MGLALGMPSCFAIAAPAVAVVAGFGIAQLQRSAQEKSGPIASATVAAVAVGATLGLPMIKAPWYWLNPDPDDVAIRVWGLQGFEAYAALGAYLHDHSQPDDRILIYGSEPQVSFLAGRRNANPFTTIYPLTGAWPRQREFQERLWAAIELAPPRYVLLAQQWQSLLADDNTDPFFESKLADVLLKQYAREYFLIYEGNRVSTLPGPDLPAGTDQGNVLMDVWRRN
jgi:hypothetical protein